ncbi:MAG: hypothetical protein WAW13_00070 [Minisyncoccia bacterium]
MPIEIQQVTQYPSEHFDIKLSKALSEGWTLLCPPVHIGQHHRTVSAKDLFVKPQDHPGSEDHLTIVHDFLYVLQRQTP